MNVFEYFYLRKKKWYHATTLYSWGKICTYGIKADINKGKELDFGYGFYLSANYQWAREYAKTMCNTDTENNLDENDVVIIEFHFEPWKLIRKNHFIHKYWHRNSKKYAEFVYNCRMYPNNILGNHNYDVVSGVMTDGNQIEAIKAHKVSELDKEDVLRVFRESTGDYQLLLHNQQICDMIKPIKVVTLKGVDLDVSSYKKKEAGRTDT